MPNQAEQKDRHKGNANTVRLPEEVKLALQQYQKNQDLSFTDAVSGIVEKFFSHGFEEKIVDFQTCEFYSGVISHPEWIRCYQHRRWQNIPTDQCIACPLYKNLKIPIMRLPRLKAYIDKRKNELADLNVEKKNLVAEIEELDKNTITGLQSLIHDLKEHLKDAGILINKKTSWIKKLDDEITALETDNGVLRSRTPIDTQEKLHSAKATVEPCMVKRVTEKEKVTEEFVQQQPQPKAPSQLNLCPKTKEMVSFEDVCEKTCMTFMECPNYNETVMLNRVIGKR